MWNRAATNVSRRRQMKGRNCCSHKLIMNLGMVIIQYFIHYTKNNSHCDVTSVPEPERPLGVGASEPRRRTWASSGPDCVCSESTMFRSRARLLLLSYKSLWNTRKNQLHISPFTTVISFNIIVTSNLHCQIQDQIQLM